MRLIEYLTKANLSDAAFAAQLGVSRQAVHRYKAGERAPEWPVLAKIREITGGEVTPDDFLPPSARDPAPAVQS